LVTEVIVDQVPAAFLGLVTEVDVLLGEPTEHQLTHLVADLEFLARQHSALLDLDGSTHQGIAVQGYVGTDLAHEDPLAGGDRVAAHDTIGNDATTAAHDAAADGAVRRQRVDLERIAPLADRLGLTDLLLFALQLALNAAATRRVPARGGELERTTVAETEQRLHQALAEGRHPHYRGAVVVLQRTGDDLRGGRTPGVDQHHHRHLGPLLRPLVGEAARHALGAATGRDDLLFAIEEQVAHRDTLIEQAARIAAQVEDQALHPRLAQPLDLVLELASRSLTDRIELHHSGRRREQRSLLHGATVDHFTSDAEGEQLGNAGATHLDRDSAARCAAKGLERLVLVEPDT